ncbi:DNA-directed RNA polymerase, mitochondrial-like isoform X3 [Dreissena polymorpha]|uniref:DNA-directed RNA polymerase, mitochondrial-like isoform X3 n=1 Tax=Dreissena polymorpha TaxID=45954 RepID=UPI002263F4D3|nr:DNA-directed RNA polymerase, mitochondrial-like isoform X3 [Dreissena polymorpha]
MSHLFRLSGRLCLHFLREKPIPCAACIQLRIDSKHIRNKSGYQYKVEENTEGQPRQHLKKKESYGQPHLQLVNTLSARASQLSENSTDQNNIGQSNLSDHQSQTFLTTEKIPQHARHRSPDRKSKLLNQHVVKSTDDVPLESSKPKEISAEAQERKRKKRLKYLSKEKKFQDALDEYYGRKNSNLKTQTIPEKSDFFSDVHKQSGNLAELYLPAEKQKLDEARKCFKFKEKQSERNANRSVDIFDLISKRNENVDVEAELSEAEGVELPSKDQSRMLPEDEWNLLKQLRRQYRNRPAKLWSEQEMQEFERELDVFHEEGDIVLYEGDHLVIPDDLDPSSLEGVLTRKALQKKEKHAPVKPLEKEEEIVRIVRNEHQNNSLLAYVDACVSTGLTRNAVRMLNLYRQKVKLEKVEIYNIVLRGLVREKASFAEVRRMFTYMREDGIQPSMESYMLCLASLAPQNSEYDRLMASFIVKDMVKQGLDVKNIFNECHFFNNERHVVYELLKSVIPDYEPHPPQIEKQYEGPLVEALNTPLPSNQKVSVNPFSGVMSSDDMMRQAERQFNLELDGFVDIKSIFNTGKPMDLCKESEMQRLEERWRKNYMKAFITKRQQVLQNKSALNRVNIYPFLCLFPVEDYVDMLLKEAYRWTTLSQSYSLSVLTMATDLGHLVYQRYFVQRKIDSDVFPKLHRAYASYVERLSDPDQDVSNLRAEWNRILQRLNDGNNMEIPVPRWSISINRMIGDFLFDIVYENTDINTNFFYKNKPVRYAKAFQKVKRSRNMKQINELLSHPMLLRLRNAEADLKFKTFEIPSLCPVIPYTSPDSGGNFCSVHDSCGCGDQQLTKFKDMSDKAAPVLDTLNILGTCAWIINKPVLEVILKVFRSGGDPDLDIPNLPDNIPAPEKPDTTKAGVKQKKALELQYSKELEKYRKLYKETNSLWWSCLYKLSIANTYKDNVMWFPMKMDFRGRVYPIPPHFNHQGQDFVRSLQMFARGKPLGPEGLSWVKLHLVNLTGLKKRSSNAEKLLYADEIMPDILDSADNPLNGRGWWRTIEEPWQCLSLCMEVANATRSGDPASYVSHVPIHQDGSCNGLQHFAALGRDGEGAKSVNLHPAEIPADVYSEVVALVGKEIEQEIESKGPQAKIAALCKEYLERKVGCNLECKEYLERKVGCNLECKEYLERKVIKQSIMTTVYGVTSYGARKQIFRQLDYKDFPDEHINVASQYLMKTTFDCMRKLFTSAKEIQTWFDKCALAISRTANSPVEWITPLNFPVIQAYYREMSMNLDCMPVFIKDSKFLQVHDRRQKNGFSPNFVHSLDATHMMLTALHCHRKGITYSAVHDCFWTHAADVNLMNIITREQFVALHSQPILQNLSQFFMDRYINSSNLEGSKRDRLANTLTSVPSTGTFDLKNVMDSTYFFS